MKMLNMILCVAPILAMTPMGAYASIASRQALGPKIIVSGPSAIASRHAVGPKIAVKPSAIAIRHEISPTSTKPSSGQVESNSVGLDLNQS